MSIWTRIAIGFGILLASYYILGLCAGSVVMELLYILVIMPITAIFMFCGDKEDVIEDKDEES